MIGTVVDDDDAGHDSLEARGFSLHSAPSLTPPALSLHYRL